MRQFRSFHIVLPSLFALSLGSIALPALADDPTAPPAPPFPASSAVPAAPAPPPVVSSPPAADPASPPVAPSHAATPLSHPASPEAVAQDTVASPAPVSSSAQLAFVDAPPGFHRERKRSLGPIIAGGAVFGLGWAASVVTGLLGVAVNAGGLPGGEPTTQFGYMFIPIAGPFVTLATEPESQRDQGMTTALAIMGGTQIVGASLLAVGFALGKSDRLVPDTAAPFVVQPMVSPTTAGVMVGGAF